jgi:uncharacterized protein (DUF58 family)
MITRRGIGFIAAAVAVFFVASTTRVGWVHIADALLWGVVLLSFAAPWAMVPGISAARRLRVDTKGGLPGPAEGDMVSAGVTLTTRGHLPRFMVSCSYAVDWEGGERDQHRWVFSQVPARGEKESIREFTFAHRGRVHLGRVAVECSAPFGLFRRRRTTGAGQSLLVYPRWYPLERVGLLEDARGETDGQDRARQGSEISGARRYVAGDPRRHIHWRNTARSGQLMVREFDSRGEESFVFAFLCGQAPDAAEAFEDAVRLSGSAARPLISRGGRVCLAFNGQLSGAFESWPEFMAALAVMKPPAPDLTALHGMMLPARACVLAFVLDTAPHMVHSLGELAAQGHPVSAVLFEGYGCGLPPGDAASMLRRRGVKVCVCHNGATVEAARVLESGQKALTPAALTGTSGAGTSSSAATGKTPEAVAA